VVVYVSGPLYPHGIRLAPKRAYTFWYLESTNRESRDPPLADEKWIDGICLRRYSYINPKWGGCH